MPQKYKKQSTNFHTQGTYDSNPICPSNNNRNNGSSSAESIITPSRKKNKTGSHLRKINNNIDTIKKTNSEGSEHTDVPSEIVTSGNNINTYSGDSDTSSILSRRDRSRSPLNLHQKTKAIKENRIKNLTQFTQKPCEEVMDIEHDSVPLQNVPIDNDDIDVEYYAATDNTILSISQFNILANGIDLSMECTLGTFHQGLILGVLGQGAQCTAIAVVACMYAKYKAVNEWSSKDLDKILLLGNDHYLLSRRLNNVTASMLRFEDVIPSITIENTAYKYEDLTRSRVMQAMFTYGNLLQHLKHAFDLTSSAVFIAANSTSAFFRFNNTFCMFDSHSNDCRGKRCYDICAGRSMLLKFNSIDALAVHIYKLFAGQIILNAERNCLSYCLYAINVSALLGDAINRQPSDNVEVMPSAQLMPPPLNRQLTTRSGKRFATSVASAVPAKKPRRVQLISRLPNESNKEYISRLVENQLLQEIAQQNRTDSDDINNIDLGVDLSSYTTVHSENLSEGLLRDVESALVALLQDELLL